MHIAVIGPKHYAAAHDAVQSLTQFEYELTAAIAKSNMRMPYKVMAIRQAIKKLRDLPLAFCVCKILQKRQ